MFIEVVLEICGKDTRAHTVHFPLEYTAFEHSREDTVA